MKIRFEWDEDKSIENKAKHDIAFEEIITVFADKKRIILEDVRHSKQEKRFYCIGKCKYGIVTVRFTYRNKTIRIFGAGKWRKGKKLYETQNKKNGI